MNSLQNKVVLITGGAKRVGAEIVRNLHSAGARVAIHHRNSPHEAEALVAELCGLRTDSAASFQLDLTDVSAFPQWVDKVLARFGQLDALINNASSFFPTHVGSIDEGAWVDLVGSNFKAPLFLSQAVAPVLRKTRGCIVNITDIHAERPLAGYPLYCAAKGALLTLTRALAIELAPDIRVNAVAPGPILWPDDGQFALAERSQIVAHTLLGREGSPADIAGAVRFLVAGAPYVTGQVINIDGGRTAHL